MPAPEPDQVVERGQREREREELPAKVAQLLPELSEVGVEPEADPDGDRQPERGEKGPFQVSARITAAVAAQRQTSTRIGRSVSSTCSGSSPRSSRWIKSR